VYNNSFEVKKIILIIIKVPGTTFINIVPGTALKYLFINNIVDNAEERHVTLIHNTSDVTSIWRRGHMMKFIFGVKIRRQENETCNHIRTSCSR
jgi:hypothetical protein